MNQDELLDFLIKMQKLIHGEQSVRKQELLIAHDTDQIVHKQFQKLSDFSIKNFKMYIQDNYPNNKIAEQIKEKCISNFDQEISGEQLEIDKLTSQQYFSIDPILLDTFRLVTLPSIFNYGLTNADCKKFIQFLEQVYLFAPQYFDKFAGSVFMYPTFHGFVCASLFDCINEYFESGNSITEKQIVIEWTKHSFLFPRIVSMTLDYCTEKHGHEKTLSIIKDYFIIPFQKSPASFFASRAYIQKSLPELNTDILAIMLYEPIRQINTNYALFSEDSCNAIPWLRDHKCCMNHIAMLGYKKFLGNQKIEKSDLKLLQPSFSICWTESPLLTSDFDDLSRTLIRTINPIVLELRNILKLGYPIPHLDHFPENMNFLQFLDYFCPANPNADPMQYYTSFLKLSNIFKHNSPEEMIKNVAKIACEKYFDITHDEEIDLIKKREKTKNELDMITFITNKPIIEIDNLLDVMEIHVEPIDEYDGRKFLDSLSIPDPKKYNIYFHLYARKINFSRYRFLHPEIQIMDITLHQMTSVKSDSLIKKALENNYVTKFIKCNEKVREILRTFYRILDSNADPLQKEEDLVNLYEGIGKFSVGADDAWYVFLYFLTLLNHPFLFSNLCYILDFVKGCSYNNCYFYCERSESSVFHRVGITFYDFISTVLTNNENDTKMINYFAQYHNPNPTFYVLGVDQLSKFNNYQMQFIYKDCSNATLRFVTAKKISECPKNALIIANKLYEKGKFDESCSVEFVENEFCLEEVTRKLMLRVDIQIAKKSPLIKELNGDKPFKKVFLVERETNDHRMCKFFFHVVKEVNLNNFPMFTIVERSGKMKEASFDRFNVYVASKASYISFGDLASHWNKFNLTPQFLE